APTQLAWISYWRIVFSELDPAWQTRTKRPLTSNVKPEQVLLESLHAQGRHLLRSSPGRGHRRPRPSWKDYRQFVYRAHDPVARTAFSASAWLLAYGNPQTKLARSRADTSCCATALVPATQDANTAAIEPECATAPASHDESPPICPEWWRRDGDHRGSGKDPTAS